MNTNPNPDPFEPESKERLRLWLRLLKTTRLVEAELRERLRLEFTTTLPRFDVMAALHRHPKGLKMSELSRFLMVSNGNVTGIVDRLAEDGFALREQVPGDRRAARARLTQKGKEEFVRQAEAHEAWLDAMLAEIGPDMASDLSTALARISDKFED
ncbi:MarR family winged helix-turn-helix transcriptional regulator [Rhodophyticola sp.]|jgi:DNA-binding MarR family transcriptional regulator|uniref:MarR family winged helix-turn-helix transcriptional regulator n=1 Tax=Rhodophyticola sp. TaxID=2680032 RepID=UPI003D2901AD